MICLNEKSEISLKVNQKAYYTFNEHGSVGITAECIIDDESIVNFIDKKTEYHNPVKMMQGASGADSATGTFIFKAIKEGTAVITINHLFRGKLENEFKIKVTVEK